MRRCVIAHCSFRATVGPEGGKWCAIHAPQSEPPTHQRLPPLADGLYHLNGTPFTAGDAMRDDFLAVYVVKRNFVERNF